MKKESAFLYCMLLIVALCGNYLVSMDQLPILPQNIIEDEIRNKYLLTCFKGNEKISLAQDIRDKITCFRNVRKSWRRFFDDPVTFRTIMQHYYEHIPYCIETMFFISSIKVPAVKPYLKLSQELSEKINILNEAQIKHYIKRGADCKCCHFSNYTFPVLFVADAPRTKILLGLGADPNIEFGLNLTPLSWAIANVQCLERAEQLERIKYLLAYNPHTKYLKIAIGLHDIEITKLILKYGNILYNEITDARYIASLFAYPTILNLLKKYEEKQCIAQKSRHLYDAIHTLTLEKIETLIQAGVNVNYHKEGNPPILLLTLDDYEKTKLLLYYGADLNDAYKGITPLRKAMRRHNLPLIQLFLSYKPKNKCLSTLVHTNNRAMVRLFIEKCLTIDDLCVCIPQSIKEKKLKIAPLFINAYPQLDSLQSSNTRQQLLHTIKLLCNLSHKDFKKLKKYA